MDAATLENISSRLDGLRGRIRRLFLLDGVSRLILAFGAFVAVTFAIDYFFILPAAVRLVLLGAGVAGGGWIVGRWIVYPLRVRISDDDLALFVERHYPELNDRLISAIQLARARAGGAASEREAGFNSPELVGMLIQDATEAAGRIDFGSVIVRTYVQRVAAAALAVALALGAAGVLHPQLTHIYSKRILGLSARWPQRTYLRVLGVDPQTRQIVIARGDDLLIEVRPEGVWPGTVEIEYEYESGQRAQRAMTEPDREQNPADDKFTYEFESVTGPFRFIVMGNDDVTDPYTVVTKTRPAVEEMRVFLQYPPYLGMQDTPADQPIIGGNLVVPQYTLVRFAAACNEEIASAKAILSAKGGEQVVALSVEKDGSGLDRVVSGSFTADGSFPEYTLALTARNGLENDANHPIRYAVKVQLDNAPGIQILDPTSHETVTQECERPFVAKVKDDHGIEKISIEYRKEGAESFDWKEVVLGAEHLKPTAYGRQVREMELEYLFRFGPLATIPNDHVRVRIRARDYKDVGGERNVSVTDEYTFKVVPISELERELQAAIELLKQHLDTARRNQRELYEKTRRMDQQFASVETLGREQIDYVRGAGLDQHGVTESLDRSRRDIEKIRLRGVYNKVFDERAAADLQRAAQSLWSAVEPGRGPSPVAASLLTQAARETASERAQNFNRTQGLQSQVLTAIDQALRSLDKWSNYQEIVRLTREAKEAQDRVNQRIPEWK